MEKKENGNGENFLSLLFSLHINLYIEQREMKEDEIRI